MKPEQIPNETKYSYCEHDLETRNLHQKILNYHLSRTLVLHNGNEGYITEVDSSYSVTITEFEFKIEYLLPK